MNVDSTEVRKATPWFREPWAWFVFSPLIVVVLVSAVTVTIAVTGADDVISDNYYREGRMINHDFSAEDNARLHHIGGTLLFNANEVHFNKITGTNLPADDKISLYLSHPSEAGRDITVELLPVDSNNFYAHFDRDLDGRWYVRLSAHADGRELWRLNGEINLSATNSLALP